MKKWILIGALALSGACTTQPDQPSPQTKAEQQREAYRRNMESATSYTDEEKRDSWLARMEQNAQTDTQAEKRESYDARMRENRNE